MREENESRISVFRIGVAVHRCSAVADVDAVVDVYSSCGAKCTSFGSSIRPDPIMRITCRESHPCLFIELLVKRATPAFVVDEDPQYLAALQF